MPTLPVMSIRKKESNAQTAEHRGNGRVSSLTVLNSAPLHMHDIFHDLDDSEMGNRNNVKYFDYPINLFYIPPSLIFSLDFPIVWNIALFSQFSVIMTASWQQRSDSIADVCHS